MKLFGEILYTILIKFAENWDYKSWLKLYGRKVVSKFLDRIEIDDLDDKVQSEILDPVKEWLERKLKINL